LEHTERRQAERRAIERATHDRRAAVVRLVELAEQIRQYDGDSRNRTVAWLADELERRGVSA